jgi:hypothetical protein
MARRLHTHPDQQARENLVLANITESFNLSETKEIEAKMIDQKYRDCLVDDRSNYARENPHMRNLPVWGPQEQRSFPDVSFTPEEEAKARQIGMPDKGVQDST